MKYSTLKKEPYEIPQGSAQFLQLQKVECSESEEHYEAVAQIQLPVGILDVHHELQQHHQNGTPLPGVKQLLIQHGSN
ncbi:hypothetical protein KIN20_000996 [Parelaphostrongylus tenuis]|uniref:Uncharacterized protein n=1 Tax=Parelaphostrongylus tenuis TaxID=148309 RepID=A0AAD5QBX3_PARTN|nr:hypothetical protein KIN20_000996 [Parelaphostrongylus tenuis]